MVISRFDSLPPILVAAAQKRARLAEHWLTAQEVSRIVDPAYESSLPTVATKLRQQWRLLAVYMDPPSSHYRYPAWQFGEDGQPVSQLHDILTVMRAKGPFTPDDQGRTTGWGEVEWFMSCNALLDGATPEEVLRTDPAAVLRAALIEFNEEE
ncbi:hypothetical protein [Stenotrophomonas sp. C-A]|nr:hypothetical protein [Stenotrophomonas maltophilia]MBN5136662.1 hypothetical protein [Stenotrophomonas maltophilia]